MSVVELRRGDERACTRTDWLTSWHSFSYGEHYDPDNVGFGPLIVSNHDVLVPGAGFDEHQHSSVDLVTFVVSGSLRHEDSFGHVSLLQAGDLQVLQAGPGVRHSEYNDSATEPVEYVQMWLKSSATVVSYERPARSASLARGDLRVIDLAPGDRYELVGGGLAHGYLVSGEAALEDGSQLSAGDALRVRGTTVGVLARGGGKFLAWTLRNA